MASALGQAGHVHGIPDHQRRQAGRALIVRSSRAALIAAARRPAPQYGPARGLTGLEHFDAREVADYFALGHEPEVVTGAAIDHAVREDGIDRERLGEALRSRPRHE